MGGGDRVLVAIAENHQQWHGFGPARDEFDDVQRRLVRPVHVLDNKDGGAARQPGQQCRGQTVGRFVLLQKMLELTSGGRRDVVEWTEWPGCEQRIARAPEDADRLRLLCQEATDERRLADPCFAAHEDDATTVLPLYRCEPLRQLGKLGLAFEQAPPRLTSIVHSHSPESGDARNRTASRARGQGTCRGSLAGGAAGERDTSLAPPSAPGSSTD